MCYVVYVSCYLCLCLWGYLSPVCLTFLYFKCILRHVFGYYVFSFVYLAFVGVFLTSVFCHYCVFLLVFVIWVFSIVAYLLFFAVLSSVFCHLCVLFITQTHHTGTCAYRHTHIKCSFLVTDFLSRVSINLLTGRLCVLFNPKNITQKENLIHLPCFNL